MSFVSWLLYREHTKPHRVIKYRLRKHVFVPVGEFFGWRSFRHKTCSCGTLYYGPDPWRRKNADYSEEYDSFFCTVCKDWYEKPCADPECEFCPNRPANAEGIIGLREGEKA